MEQERRDLVRAYFVSVIAHGALIFLITINFKGGSGANNSENDSKEDGSQEMGSGFVPVELLPKPADTKQKEKQAEDENEIETSKKELTATNSANFQDCPNFFGGIGMTYNMLDVVTNVPDGYPAARAGILPGDILQGDTGQIRGEIGTAVDVVVIRGKKTLKFSMIREKICISEERKIKR